MTIDLIVKKVYIECNKNVTFESKPREILGRKVRNLRETMIVRLQNVTTELFKEGNVDNSKSQQLG